MDYIIVYSSDFTEVIQENVFSSKAEAEHAMQFCMPYMDMDDIVILAVE